MNKSDKMNEPEKMSKFDWIVLVIGIIVLVIMIFLLRGCEREVYKLDFYIKNTYENTHLLEKYVNEVERYVPEDVYKQLLLRYEEAKSASSDLLDEYLEMTKEQ